MTFFLITENTFHAGYLIAQWRRVFQDDPDYGGIVVRDDPVPEQVRKACLRLHARAAMRQPDAGTWEQIYGVYPDLTDTERAMIEARGVPEYAIGRDLPAFFAGPDLNSDRMRDWVVAACSSRSAPFFFVFLDQLLAPWWIEVAGGRIINAHSAVLPHARGMFAIEQVAALGDAHLFRRAAGASVHYVDNGVDTGPIIRAERFADPFAFPSLWACKAACFALAFDLLIEVAARLEANPDTLPLGTPPDPSRIGPQFRSAQFTPRRRQAAQAGYLAMRG